jgi:2-(1,2-epoxy-1,2-dihydrophenyl)acetyl-CoA isomerase
MPYESVRLTLEGNVAILTLARPDRLNALTPALLAEAMAAIDEALAAGAKALIVTGEGRAFCSGADLRGGLAEHPSDDTGDLIEKAFNPFVRKFAELDIPVVTAVNGAAAGGGCALALLGDISVMARSAYLLLAFVNIGLVPDMGATWLVAKSAGRAKALEMALLGEKMGAEEALAAGLVTRVVDDAQVLDEARAIARKLAAGPTVALGLMRKQVASALALDLNATLDLERDNQARTGRTQDFKEAIAAFIQKRVPVFKGQ